VKIKAEDAEMNCERKGKNRNVTPELYLNPVVTIKKKGTNKDLTKDT